MEGLLELGAVGLQAAIFALVVVGARRGNVSVVVNGLVALAAALAPWIVSAALAAGFDHRIAFGPALPLWLAVAGLLHTVGMLGRYDDVWWWDHLTHTTSSSVIAALLYAGLLTLSEQYAVLTLPSAGPAVLTVALVLVAGVFWELLELFARTLARWFDVEPVLQHYGPGDTELDLVFDVVGALLVVLFDVRVFVPLTRQYPRATETVLVAAGVVVLVASLGMTLVVAVDGTEWPWSDRH